MRAATPLESVLMRDRILVLSGIIGLVALAWALTATVANWAFHTNSLLSSRRLNWSGLLNPQLRKSHLPQ